jgi:glycosyltransferase involved in cell wall biosynthesis
VIYSDPENFVPLYITVLINGTPFPMIKQNPADANYTDGCLYQFLTQIFPEIRKEVPDFEIVVAYGFKNWEIASKMRNDVDSLNFIEKIKKAMDQPGVNYVDRISKKQLAEYQMQSKVWLFPTWFFETFCINSPSNGLAKNAIVTSDLGGLTTTVGNSGILIPSNGLNRDNPFPENYVNNFVGESIKLLKDEDYRLSWAEKAYNKALQYSWSNIADEWIRQFKAK